MIDGSGDAEFGASAGDVAVQRINFGALPAVEVLGGGGKSSSHLRGDFEGAGYGSLGILESRRMNAGGASDGENFQDHCLNEFAGIGAGGNLSISGMAQGGDGIQGTVPGELGPKLAGNVVRDAAGDGSAFEEGGKFFSLRIAGPDDEIAAAGMRTTPGRGAEAAT